MREERHIEPYAINAPVTVGERRGVVTGSAPRGGSPDPERFEYRVRLVGSRESITLRSGELAPAPEFPPLVLGHRTVATLAEAEDLYARLEARIIVDSRLGTVPGEDDLNQLATLAEGLATWGGTTPADISHSLGAAVEHNINRLLTEPHAPRLAQPDLPPAGARPSLGNAGANTAPADPPAGAPTRQRDKRDGPRPRP